MASRRWVLFEFFQFANTPEYGKLALWFRCRLLHNMFRLWKKGKQIQRFKRWNVMPCPLRWSLPPQNCSELPCKLPFMLENDHAANWKYFLQTLLFFHHPDLLRRSGLSGSSLFSFWYHSLYYLHLTSFSHLGNINNSFLFYMWQIKSLTARSLICLNAFARELAYQGNILL